MNFLTPTSLDSSTPVDEGILPSWLTAADNHNIGNNQGGSWFDPTTWENNFQNAGKFISVSVLSGANSFYNTGVTVGNWFGAAVELRETNNWISTLDSNLGAYYDQNRESADLAGFVASSLIPGLGGIKILTAGQKALSGAVKAGSFGANMSRATGLLVPATEDFVKLAAKDLAATNASFSLINGNVVKALASGTWQQVLEGAAFETAVQATMFKSPVLQDQDVGDIVKNVAIGGLLGGAIGGSFEAARTFTSLKKALRIEDKAAKPFTSKEAFDEAFSPSSKVVLGSLDLESGAIPIPPMGAIDDPLYVKDTKNFLDKVRRTNNDSRTLVHEMVTGKDLEIGNLLADTIHVNPEAYLAGEVGSNTNTVLNNFLHADGVARLSKPLKVENDIREAIKSGNIGELDKFHVRYVKILGQDAGDISANAPMVVSIADKVLPRAGQSTKDAVLAEVKSYGFSTKKLWDASKLSGLSAHNEAEARYIWFTQNAPKIKEGTVFHENDIPALEHIFQTNQWNGIKLVDELGVQNKIKSSQELYETITASKERVANQLLLDMSYKGNIPIEYGTDAISRIVNTSRDYLEGTRSLDKEYNDLFYRQGINKAYAEAKVAAGLSNKVDLELARTEFLPEYAKVGYRIPEDAALFDGNIANATSYLASQQAVFQKTLDNVWAKGAGELASQAPEITDTMLASASRVGAGPTLVSFAAGKYGSLEAAFEQLGSVTQRLKLANRESASELLNGPLVQLANDSKAAIEISTIWSKIAGTAEHYILAEDGALYGLDSGPMLVARKIAKPQAVEEGFEGAGVKLQQGAPEFIPINNDATYAALKAHRDVNARRISLERDRQAALGRENFKDLEVIYPVRPNTQDYDHFAFVVDPKITGAGHMSMIHAASESELKELIARVPVGYKTLLKDDVEEFYRAQGSYDYNRTLNENYVDADLRKKGIASEFFVQTDSKKIVDNILQHNLRQEDIAAVELVRMKYQKQFDWLEDQAGQYSKLEGSAYQNTLEKAEKFGKNPYLSYIKLGLDVSRASENPLLYSMNKALDGAVSRAYAKVSELWGAAKTPAEMDSVNAALKEAGYNNAYYDAALNQYANHPAPKGELSKFIRNANALLSKFTLGLDPMNALNNTIGANVLRGTELSQVTRAIAQGNPELVGKLAELTQLALPGVTEGTITSPAKLMASSIKRYFGPESKALIKEYTDAGYIRGISAQFHSILDDIALKGTETVDDLSLKLNSAFGKAKALVDKGEAYSGNKIAEEFNRFLSADVMRQITDVGVQGGVLSAKEAKAYINTFVNRVEGNTIASQRPLLFSGPIGQAIGLFQSYQFNLLQNLFRYVGEGRGKDVSTLLGLQGTFYGLNGMPGFSFINQHIVGTASGNTNHKDLYDATYGIAGKTAGEFLLYGMPSFGLQANLYTRGDINPRQVTIIPTTLAEVPIVGAFGKFFASLAGVATNVNNGAPVWESFLNGVEHNGISRPLAGVAQVMRAAGPNGSVYSTSNKGTIMGQNDFLSWSSAVRLAGARPMDEAIVNDAFYRINAYAAVDRTKKQNLAEAVKLSVEGGLIPKEDQVATFAEKYAASGGKQGSFNKYIMEQYKKATLSQSQQILHQVQNPLTYKMQLLMGGEDGTGY
jgi:hypothetical protein